MIRAPVYVVTDAMLRQNGGQFELMGGAVTRVNYSTEVNALAAGDRLIGGALTPVYFVSTTQLATNRFKLAGDHSPASGKTYLYAGNINRGIMGHIAIPVYDPNYGKWFDPLGEGLCVWAAYQPKGAASFAASLVDLSGNGNDAIDPGAGATPGWDVVNGWTFDGIQQYLDTTFVPDADYSQTMIVQFSDAPTSANPLFGWEGGLGDDRVGINPDNGANQVRYNHGSLAGSVAAPAVSLGNLGISGQQGYRSGVADGGAIPGWFSESCTEALCIGALRSGAFVAYFRVCRIQALAFYVCELTAPQVLDVATAMAAV